MDEKTMFGDTAEYRKSLNDEVCVDTLKQVYGALQEKGYDPINQIVGYLISGDPTYITGHRNARFLMSTIERDELLAILVKSFIANNVTDNNVHTENHDV